MSKVPEHLIEEARKRGIVPGATILSTVETEGVVLPCERWQILHGGLYCPGLSLRSPEGEWATVITPAQSQAEGLKEGDAVECGPAMRAAIIELADELGIGRYMGGLVDFTVLYISDGRLHGRYDKGATLDTPEAFIAKMRVTAAQPKPIKIGSDTVKFNDDKSITV